MEGIYGTSRDRKMVKACIPLAPEYSLQESLVVRTMNFCKAKCAKFAIGTHSPDNLRMVADLLESSISLLLGEISSCHMKWRQSYSLWMNRHRDRQSSSTHLQEPVEPFSPYMEV